VRLSHRVRFFRYNRIWFHEIENRRINGKYKFAKIEYRRCEKHSAQKCIRVFCPGRGKVFRKQPARGNLCGFKGKQKQEHLFQFRFTFKNAFFRNRGENFAQSAVQRSFRGQQSRKQPI
jgi:hypothetical protein